VVFPGVNPITDLISGSTSVPTYPDVPTTVRPLDPWYVGTSPNGAGWTNNMERVFSDWAGVLKTWPAGSPPSGGGTGASVPAGPTMRPVVAGITS